MVIMTMIKSRLRVHTMACGIIRSPVMEESRYESEVVGSKEVESHPLSFTRPIQSSLVSPPLADSRTTHALPAIK